MEFIWVCGDGERRGKESERENNKITHASKHNMVINISRPQDKRQRNYHYAHREHAMRVVRQIILSPFCQN